MRVLAINDLSCVGKCSLSVSLPILSACGITCDVLPTALLSTHTGGFNGYTFRDLTNDIPDMLKQWKTLGLQFDYIYSGYLGSVEQIELVLAVKKDFLAKGGKFIVDPVMGDGGKLYTGFNENFVEKMKMLCLEADFILPNLTEACALASLPYPQTDGTLLIDKLTSLCSRPVITGITQENEIAVYYTGKLGEVKKYVSQNVAGFFHGAGDVFASAFVGALANGKDEDTAIALAADFTTAAVARTANEVEDKRYGLNFEAEIFPFLKNLFSSSNR